MSLTIHVTGEAVFEIDDKEIRIPKEQIKYVETEEIGSPATKDEDAEFLWKYRAVTSAGDIEWAVYLSSGNHGVFLDGQALISTPPNAKLIKDIIFEGIEEEPTFQ